MSTTQIYLVTNNSCIEIGETKNAFRGAMYVWNEIAKKYFGLSGFPHFDESMMSRIWNAGDEHQLTDCEKIVLASTMDFVTVKSADRERLCMAFDEYAKDHPNSSISEQSDLIRSAEISAEEKISWCQTSVCEFQFAPDYDDEENPVYNDLSKAWDLFEQFDGNKPA